MLVMTEPGTTYTCQACGAEVSFNSHSCKFEHTIQAECTEHLASTNKH